MHRNLKDVIANFAAGCRFKDGIQQENSYSMIDRKQEFVLIHRIGRNIIIVIGPKQDQANGVMKQIAVKLKVS
jgi:predicted regulator of Ras-like GTPase activity (Roadblock/LC7/MglB family)